MPLNATIQIIPILTHFIIVFSFVNGLELDGGNKNKDAIQHVNQGVVEQNVEVFNKNNGQILAECGEKTEEQVKEFTEILNKLKAHDYVHDVNHVFLQDWTKLAKLSVQIGPDRVESSIASFCMDSTKGKNKQAKIAFAEQCLSEHILDKWNSGWIEDPDVGIFNALAKMPSEIANSRQLLKSLLMPQKLLETQKLRQILTGSSKVARVEDFDHFLEIFLAKPKAEMIEIVELYKDEYASSIVGDIENWVKQPWLGDKDAMKAVAEILKGRVQILSKIGENELHNDFKTVIEACKKWPRKEQINLEIIANLREADTSVKENIKEETTRLNEFFDSISKNDDMKSWGEPTEKEIVELLKNVQQILTHFEPDTADSQQFAKECMAHCSAITNFIFEKKSTQRHYDQLFRMMAVANLLAPNSRDIYFQEKFSSAVVNGQYKKKNFNELNYLIATRHSVDLKHILREDEKFEQCESGNNGGSSGGNGCASNKIINFEFLQNVDKKYRAILTGIFDQILMGSCYDVKKKMVETHGRQPPPSFLERQKVHEILTRHKQMSLKKMSKFMESFAGIMWQKMTDWCGREQRESAKNFIGIAVGTTHQRNEQQLMNGFCIDLLKIQSASKEHSRQVNLLQLLVQFLSGIKRDQHKLDELNQLIKANEWRFLSPMVNNVLKRVGEFAQNGEKIEEQIIFKLLRKVLSPSSAGPIQPEDIEALEHAYNDFHNTISHHHPLSHRHKREILVFVLFVGLMPISQAIMLYMGQASVVAIFALIVCASATGLNSYGLGEFCIRLLGSLMELLLEALILKLFEAICSGSN